MTIARTEHEASRLRIIARVGLLRPRPAYCHGSSGAEGSLPHLCLFFRHIHARGHRSQYTDHDQDRQPQRRLDEAI